ncbi:MAG TPA: hypothetical protein VJA17_05360, partial [Candidatus Omnitrophota bacterium]|nr:hypothetical protein [Candidatus Omnitrophota bacterium]
MAICITLLTLATPAHAGDITATLDTTDGTSKFVVKDSAATSRVSILSTGNVGIGILELGEGNVGKLMLEEGNQKANDRYRLADPENKHPADDVGSDLFNFHLHLSKTFFEAIFSHLQSNFLSGIFHPFNDLDKGPGAFVGKTVIQNFGNSDNSHVLLLSLLWGEYNMRFERMSRWDFRFLMIFLGLAVLMALRIRRHSEGAKRLKNLIHQFFTGLDSSLHFVSFRMTQTLTLVTCLILLTFLTFPTPAHAGDITATLDTTDGTSKFVVKDSAATSRVSILSNGNVGIGIWELGKGNIGESMLEESKKDGGQYADDRSELTDPEDKHPADHLGFGFGNFGIGYGNFGLETSAGFGDFCLYRGLHLRQPFFETIFSHLQSNFLSGIFHPFNDLDKGPGAFVGKTVIQNFGNSD